MQYQLDIKKLSNEEQQMIIGDISSARQRETQVQTSEYATQLAKNVSPYLALGTTTVTLTLFFILVFTPDVIQQESKEVLLYILGVLSAILSQIYSYYFGSSAGSAAKSHTLANMQPKP
jgi:K+-sensing histidine kinase KdpD